MSDPDSSGPEKSSHGLDSAAESPDEKMSRRAAPTSGQLPAGVLNTSSALPASGLKHLPAGTAGQGVGLAGSASGADLFGQVVVGPYNIGSALRTGTTSQLGLNAAVGSLVNFVVTGWVVNTLSARPSPLDSFGIVASAVAQIGMGLFLTPAPVLSYSQKQ